MAAVTPVPVNPYVGIQCIALVDFSGSMNEPMGKNDPQKRIDVLRSKIHYVFSQALKYDPDGIDVITFNHEVTAYSNVKTPEMVNQIFAQTPEGTTNTVGAVDSAFNRHLQFVQQPNFKATVVLVFTDGVPDSRSGLEKKLAELSNKVRSGTEIGFSFLQVGHDEKAFKYLAGLDDLKKKYNIRHDIVDRKNFADVGGSLTIEKIYDDALND